VRADVATARLLWAACRPAPEPESVSAAIDAGADVAWAARVAVPQHAGPLLWRALASAGQLERLEDAREPLHTDFEIRRAEAALLLPRALAAAVEPLTHSGLEPVVLKGPALAVRYPEPGLRPMDDIDLLLAPDQHEAAIGVLVRAGWRVSHGPARHPYDTVLHHSSVPHLPLELHHGIESWRDRAHALTGRGLWARRTPLACMGVAAFGLPVEDELVMLAAHAAKPFHHFQRIIWSVDMAVVVETAGNALEWEAVSDRARDARCETALAVALRHARRLGARVPDDLVALPARGWRRAALEPVLDETWPLVVVDRRAAHRLRYALPDAAGHRALLTLGELTAEGAMHVPARATQLFTKVVRGSRARR
jgi:hypothetical protein